MRRKRNAGFTLIAGLLAIGVILPSLAGAQEEGYPFSFKNFKLEFYGGYTPIRPEALNKFASYEESYVQFYYIQRYATPPSGLQSTVQRTGDEVFRSLERAIPWGGRLRYQFSPTFALAVGLQYLTGEQNSSVGLAASLRDNGVETYSDRYDNAGFNLSIKAWLPQLGAYFGWNLGPVLRGEVFIAGGPMFAEIRAASAVRQTVQQTGGNRSDYSTDVELKGSQKTWTGELGAVLRIRPAKFFDLFCEAGYAFRQCGALSGPGSSTTKTSDSTTGEKIAETSWEGQWRIFTVASNESWGKFSALKPSNSVSWQQSNKKFVLEFSAFQIKLGLGVRL